MFGPHVGPKGPGGARVAAGLSRNYAKAGWAVRVSTRVSPLAWTDRSTLRQGPPFGPCSAPTWGPKVTVARPESCTAPLQRKSAARPTCRSAHVRPSWRHEFPWRQLPNFTHQTSPRGSVTPTSSPDLV